MKNPDLIQRMKLKQPVPANGSVDDCLAMDYMGSAEFEFGALPASLKRVCKGFAAYKQVMFKDVKDFQGRRLMLLCKPDDEAEYAAFLRSLAKSENEYGLRLKEQPYFLKAMKGIDDFTKKKIEPYRIIDAWWDLDNDVFWCFGKPTMDIITRAIQGTIEKKRVEERRSGIPDRRTTMAGHKIIKVTAHDNETSRVITLEHETGDYSGRTQTMYLHVDKMWSVDDVVNALVKRGYLRRWQPDGSMTLEGVARYARDFVEEVFANRWWEVKPNMKSWADFLKECADGYDEATLVLFNAVPPWRFAVAYGKTIERATEDFTEDARSAFVCYGRDGEVKVDVGKRWEMEVAEIIDEYKMITQNALSVGIWPPLNAK